MKFEQIDQEWVLVQRHKSSPQYVEVSSESNENYMGFNTIQHSDLSQSTQ